MKCVSRELTVYTHTFGHFDKEANEMTGIIEFETPEKLSERRLKTLSAQYGVLLETKETKKKFQIPADVFMKISNILETATDTTITIKDGLVYEAYELNI